jgi:N-hydroxyarylamine O-acetyltransferase
VDEATLAAYLDRLGASWPAVADAAALRELHLAHQVAVPFENLSIHLGEPIVLDEAALVQKIVARRRGGFCYELNGAFAGLLRALGFEVTLLAARAYGGSGLGPPFDHLALRVRAGDGTGPWLADVGFGAHSHLPLLFDARDEQDDPGGRFRLADAPEGDVEVWKDGRAEYRLERRQRSLADFAATCWWHQTSPESHFTRSTICSRLTGDGRISVSGRLLIRTTAAGARSEEPLATDGEVLAAYRDHFGIRLDRVPGTGPVSASVPAPLRQE